MAWIDDRIWCHPKFSDISDRAFRVWVSGVAYSTGFATRGILTPGQQKQVGSDPKVRRQLIEAGLWDEGADDTVRVHDWDEHNSKRDARRESDRERKRVARAADKAGQSGGTSAGQSKGRSTLPARVDGSEGSDGSETDKCTDLFLLVPNQIIEQLGTDRSHALSKLLKLVTGADNGTPGVLAAFCKKLPASEIDDVRMAYAQKGSLPIGKAVNALKDRVGESETSMKRSAA